MTVQLKWFHGFQFAGYYAAVEKGFYTEEGLQVTLQERSRGESHIQAVLDGKAEYGVADAGLLLSRIAGKPVVLLKQIFQHSPLVVMTRQESGISTPFDLRKKRLMLDQKGASTAPIVALLHSTLGSLDQVVQVEQSFDLGDLIAGDVDALAGYITGQPFELHRRGVAINVINPRDYGIDFYGDNLFTTETEIQHHPARVEKMIRATLKGWQYALGHPEEVIDLIRRDYNSQIERDDLLDEAGMIAFMIALGETPLGTVSPSRYAQVAEAYLRAGFVGEEADLTGFIYRQQGPELDSAAQPGFAPFRQLDLTEKLFANASRGFIDWRVFYNIGLIVALIVSVTIVFFWLLNKSRKTPLAYQFSSPASKGIAVLFNIALIAVAILLAGWALSNIKEKMQENMRDSLQAVLHATLKNLHTWCLERKVNLEIVANDPSLIWGVSSQLARYEEGQELFSSPGLIGLRVIQATFPNRSNYSDALVVAPDGVILASLHNENIGKTSLLLQYHPDLLRRAFDGESVLIPPTPSPESQEDDTSALASVNKTTMFFATPIRDKGGKVMAVLVESLDPTDEVIRLFTSSRIGQTGETYIFDRQGRLLSESRFLHHLVTIGLIQPMGQTILAVEERDPGGDLTTDYRTDIPRNKQPLTRMAASATQGIAGYDMEGYRDYRGVPVLGAWLWDDELEIGMSCKIDKAEAMAGYQTAKLVVGVTLMVTVGGSCLFTLFFLVVGSRANRALQAANDLLEERVEQRTHELKIIKLAVDNSPNSIVIADISGKIQYVNRAFTEHYGYSSEEVIGNNLDMYHSKENPLEYYDGRRKAILSGNVWRSEFIGRKKNGETLYEETVLTPITDNDDTITHLVAVKVDITEKKKSEKELLKALADAKAATSAKSMFLANMSHEIRTPMNAIIGMSVLLMRTALNQRQRYYLRTMESSAKALLGLIDDILDISKIEAGKLTIERTAFNLTETLDDVISLFLAKMDEKDLELLITIDPDIPPFLIGDPGRLAQVFNNLLSNAVKFTEEGEIEIIVRLLDRQSESLTLECSVADTGIGVLEEQVAILFDAFSQVDSSTTRKYGGTGLGLAISKQLLELMGGNISVENVSNEGAKFTFSLPLEHGPDRRKNEKVVGLPAELRERKVLLVVANRKKRDNIARQLQSLSFQVDSCAEYSEALAVFNAANKKNRHHALIVADLECFEKEGLCISETMNEFVGLSRIPFIFISGIERLQKIEQCTTDHQGLSLLQKPVTPNGLFNAIVEAFGYDNFVINKRCELGDILKRVSFKVKGASILLVEDNEINQQVATELLQLAEIQISLAGNGVEALAMVQQQNFDLVLMDIQMPEMDGITATRHIRALESEAKDVPIVAMTGNAMSGDRDRSLAAGMNDHITKPIDAEVLFSCLIKWIRHENGHRRSLTGQRQNEDWSVSQRLESPEEQQLDFGLILPGIDTVAGLKRVAGNTELYRNLLQHFLMDNENIGDQIEDAWSQGDQEKALRLVHTMKGIASTIGAVELQENALKLETGMQELSENIPNLLKDTWDRLQLVLAGIRGLPHVYQKKIVSSVVPGTGADFGSIMPKIRELELLLLINDMAAEDVFLEIQGVFSSLLPEQTELFARALDSLDFKRCLEVLRQIENNPGEREENLVNS